MPLSASVTARLRYQHESATEIIKPYPEQVVRSYPVPGKWSAFDNIAHLASYQPTFLRRLHRIGQEDNPLFEAYKAENDPLFGQYQHHSLQELSEDLKTQRFLIINFINQAGEPFLRRKATHPVYGIFTTAQWIDFFLLHEAHHLFTIFRLLGSAAAM